MNIRPGIRLSCGMAAGLALAFAMGWAPGVHAAGKAAPKVVPPELQPETLTTSAIDAKYGARVYVADVALSHIPDGRIRVFDALGGKFLGMISTGYVGNFTLTEALAVTG